MQVEAIGERVVLRVGKERAVMTLAGAMELVTDILKATDQVRGFGEAIRGEVVDRTANQRAAGAAASRRYRERKREREGTG